MRVQKPGFSRKYFVTTDRLGKKPGFFTAFFQLWGRTTRINLPLNVSSAEIASSIRDACLSQLLS